MGELIKISCSKCGQVWNSKRGHGKNHAKLEVVIRLFEESVQEQIKQLAEEDAFVVFDFAYIPVVCKECGMVDSVPVLELLNKKRVFVGMCSRCGKEIPKDRVKASMRCPVCQSEEMTIERSGFWD